MPPRDHGFRGPRHVSAPNRNFFRFTVVNCATHRVTQRGVSFLQFEELVTAKARKIGVKFNSWTKWVLHEPSNRGLTGHFCFWVLAALLAP